MCKHCRHIFIAETPLVDKHCQLSNNLKRALTLALQDTRSMASIAHDYDISIPSVTSIQFLLRYRQPVVQEDILYHKHVLKHA